MNHKHIFDLTVRLSQALDQNYDVVNMDAVISVISSLEGTTITKEQLEATRLAKYINQLRRRTKSEHLARRAKSLLKKWREMVGIQQTNEPSSSNVSLVTNDNAVSAKLQHHPLSQPTSPNEGMSLESASNSKANSSADFLRSTVSNPTPTVSTLTRSANLNVHNSDRLEFAERRIAACVSTLAMPADGGKQPTSFANLLAGFCNENNAKASTISTLGPTITGTSPHTTRKLIKIKEREVDKSTETFTIDQSSNSNSEIMSAHAMQSTNNVSVVINIQDSNSGSNPITPKIVALDPPCQQILSKVSSKKITPLGAIPKQKKTKKEKKRKERDLQTEMKPCRFNDLVANDETSSNQTQQTHVEANKFFPVVEDKTRIVYPNSNISGILSLSNSSISSNEPGFVRVVEEKIKFDLNASSRPFSSNLSKSDLTFAGKFKHQNCSNITPLLNKEEKLTLNGADMNFTEPPSTETTKAAFTQKHPQLKFVPFSDSGCNSNDSTSNSHASQFDVIDIANQYRNQSKLIHEIRPSKKPDNVCNAVTHDPQKPPTESNFTLPITTTSLPSAVDVFEVNASANAVDNIEKKIPKKRGRKKGSKGVDSVIAKESSLSSQMFITALGSGGKKVKTTKELYAEMQNRKKGVSATTSSSSPTLMNWAAQLQSNSQPGSSCSEPSLHSPGTLEACSTNATMSTLATLSAPEKFFTNTNADEGESDSDTATSEPSRDSIAVHANYKVGISTESNNYIKPQANKIYGLKQIEALSSAVEKQLLELLKQLPMVPNIQDIEAERAADMVSCSCRIIEVLPQPDKLKQPSKIDGVTCKVHTEMNSSESEPIVAVNIIKEEPIELKLIVTKSPKALTQQKPKKSIFDLDFDEDEDPLQILMAESSTVSTKREYPLQSKSILPNKAEECEIPDLTVQSGLPNMSANELNSTHNQTTLLMPIFPSYEVEEDPYCAAKQRFEIQTQKITNFHIDALHNCYIANVNGNWDNADTVDITTEIDEAGKSEKLASNVVPKYGSLVNERIKKDLSYICFTKNFKPKKHSMAHERLYGLPFLGMARRSEKRKRSPDHSHIACHKAKISMANHENVNVKGDNLNNVCLNLKLQDNVDNDFKNIDTCASNMNEIVQSESVFDSNIRNVYLNDEVTKISSLNIMGTNNNVVLKDITLDIIDEVLDTELSRISNEHTCSQNLLAIAHTLNYSNHHNILATVGDLNNSQKLNLKTNTPPSTVESQNYGTTTYSTTSLETNTVNLTKGNDNNPIDFFKKSNESLQFDCAVLNHTIDKPVNDDHASSRRSSSCSNSSLKQTQHSINMKLRRRRLLEQEEHKLVDVIKRKHKRKRTDKKKRKHYNSDTEYKETDNEYKETDNEYKETDNEYKETDNEYKETDNEYKETDNEYKETDNEYKEKPPIIKRIKIAINGDIATQRQISLSSSNNSSDENADDEQNSHVVNIVDESDELFDDDHNSINSAVSRNSIIDDEDHTSKECVDLLERDEEEDADFEDDDEDYSGDFHEVVTRDISAPSNSNNHIVLTIKKTPSKTNSPSNSLSAMSPIITCVANAITNTTTTATTCTAPGNVLSSTLKPQILNFNADHTKPVNKSVYVASSIFEEVLTCNIEDGTAIGLGTTQRTANENESGLHMIASTTPVIVQNSKFSGNVRKQNSRRRHLRRKVKKLKPFLFPNESTNNMGRVKKKLHKQLFFSHEINVRLGDGHKDTTLNISSCSSNCSEDSEYESYNSSTEDDDNDVIDINKIKGNKEIDSIRQIKVNKIVCSPTTSDCSTLSSYDNTVSDSIGATTNFVNVSKNLTEDQATITCRTNSPVKNNQTLMITFDGDFAVDAPTTSGQDNKALCTNTQSNTTDAKIEPSEEIDECEKLPEKNNGLLMSFNNIFHSPNAIKLIENIDKIGVVYDAQQVHRYDEQLTQQLQNENCDDDYNNLYNNNNTFNIMNYDCNQYRLDNNDSCNNRYKQISCNSDDIQFVDNDKSVNITSSANTDKYKTHVPRKRRQLIPHKEYRTGMRAVDEDVDDDEGNNCARIQQFKEWHHVLQLRSYNDELLTVLPYVVLD